MDLSELLKTRSERLAYHDAWHVHNQANRHSVESQFNTHSGHPIIGVPMQYGEHPLFRARVSQKRLRDAPSSEVYDTADRYIGPFWHITHHIKVAEQMYHACANRVREGSQTAVIDTLEKSTSRLPIFWNDQISVELILEDLGKWNRFDNRERASFAFYNQRNHPISRLQFMTYVERRAYVKSIDAIKEGNAVARDKLIRQVEGQDANLKRRKTPRKDLDITAEELINRIKQGDMPEDALHEFFSMWDRT